MADELGTVDLKHSIPVKKEGGGTVEVSKLTFGRVKLKHLKLLPNTERFLENGTILPHELVPLVAGLADISDESAGEIDIDDLDVIGEKFESFFGKSLETGKKKSTKSLTSSSSRPVR